MFTSTKNKLVALSALGMSLVSGLASAVEPWDTINASVDFTDAIASIGVIAGALFAVYVIIKGIRLVFGLIK